MVNRCRMEVKRGRFGAIFPTVQPGSRLKPNLHAGLLSKPRKNRVPWSNRFLPENSASPLSALW
jgi:hypothetical protein